MADNIAVTQGSGTSIATDDVGGVHHQVVKVEFGKDGKAAGNAKFAPIQASSAGDNTIVAANASKSFRVISYVISASGAVNAKWKRGSTDVSGLLYMDAKGGAVANEAQKGHFETNINEALILNLSGAVAVGGHITYLEEA